MFELGREFRRLFGAERFGAERQGAAVDGLTGGDAALLELLDLDLLHQEGQAADMAAAQAPLKDKPQRRLESAVVWREVARRSGDGSALRKAAALCEIAVDGFDPQRQPQAWARARCEQAYCLLLDAELSADPHLDAAETALREARCAARDGLGAALAQLGLAVIAARREQAGDVQAAYAACARFAAPIAALDALTRKVAAARAHAAEARLVRADLMRRWGARLKDAGLLKAALEDAALAVERLDSASEPLTWARAEIVRGQALTAWGAAAGDINTIALGAEALACALDHLTRDYSPFDWAGAQIALGQALQALGEASDNERAYEKAVTCFDRAGLVLKDMPASPLRGVAAGARAVCLARSAELTGDLAVLDAAEAAMKIGLSALDAGRDPVSWALSQTHLARLYEARLDITGRDRGERFAAITALDAACQVFEEQSLCAWSIPAAEALARLRCDQPAAPRRAV